MMPTAHVAIYHLRKKDANGNVTRTSVLDANGLILGTDADTLVISPGAASAPGSQQIKQLGSGITGTDGTVSTYDTTVTGQGDYNNAASIGDVQTILHAAQDVFAGNNSSKATLTLGKTATFKGADVVDDNGTPLTNTALSSKLQADYSNANITTATSSDSDGGVTTNFYLKKDLVGRSLTLGTIGPDGNVAASDRTASLYQAQSKADSDTAMTGHLFLAGEKRTAYADNPTVTQHFGGHLREETAPKGTTADYHSQSRICRSPGSTLYR